MKGKPARWIERWIRFGFLMKGFVYILLGILAVQAALTYRQQAQDTQGVLRAIAHQPLGNLLLIIVAVGLAGYSFGRLIQAVLYPESDGKSLKHWFKRAGCGMSSLAYGALAYTAVEIIQGVKEESEQTQFWTAKVLSWPFGQWLVGGVGIGVLGIGITFFYRTLKADFLQRLKLGTMNTQQRTVVVAIGRAGYLARGIIFAIIGGYVMQAAHAFDADKVRSSEGALVTIKQQPYGPGLLSLVAVGLIAYGVHMGLQARYRQIELP